MLTLPLRKLSRSCIFASMSHPILRIKDLCIDFRQGRSSVRAADHVSFTLPEGCTLGIVGESGSGKSVTALSIMRLIQTPPGKISKGSIHFGKGEDSTDLLALSEKEMRAYRGNRIGMVFQEPMTSLNPVYSCGRQLEESIRLHLRTQRKESRELALHWLNEVKLPRPDSVLRSYPHQLSGGQKQRVMLAMAMCCNPDILIADEPTTALDVTIQKTILELIAELQSKTGMSVIFITHDLGVVAQIAQEVLVMYRGSIVEQGAVKTVFENPSHPYTRGLLACRPVLHTGRYRLPTVDDFLSGREVSGSGRELAQEIPQAEVSATTLVSAGHLKLWYPEKRNLLGKAIRHVKAVDDVSFNIFSGETLGLVGESGCGKTSLGRCLIRLAEASSGKILFDGNDLLSLPSGELRRMRREFQIIFQDPYSSLSPRMMVGDALMEPLKVHGIGKNRRERKEIVIRMMQKTGLEEDHFYRYPHEFSGGQRQRICIARALVLQPRFIVCDECVSALDVSVQAQVLNLLNDLKKEFGLTYLFISHDLSVVRYMSDRILVMKDGKIVESGPAEEIYQHPAHPYTQSLIAAIPRIRQDISR